MSVHGATLLVTLASLSGCGAPDTTETTFEDAVHEVSTQSAELNVLSLARQHVGGDVYHYSLLLKVGSTPNARIGLHRVVRERAPFVPYATRHAVMLEHGDFASFTSNFISEPGSDAEAGHRGLAPFLAQHDVDVWGMDRRWATTPAGPADVSDFATLGFATSIADIGTALTFARGVRTLSGAGSARFTLLGFSSGALLSYAYAGAETARPAAARHVKALAPLDIYARIAPEDEELRLRACARRDQDRADIEAGNIDIDNTFFQLMGSLAQSAPDAPSDFFPGLSNLEAMYSLVGETYQFYQVTPWYHLSGLQGPELSAGLRFSQDARIQAWLSQAPPHQSYVEGLDLDTIQCGEAPLPLPDRLDDIRVPIFYLGAAGGYGEHGIYSTAQTQSRDVTTLVVRRLDAENERNDFGHADLLFAEDAPTLAWQPLLEWLRRH